MIASTFTGSETEIFYRVWEPAGTPKATVIFVHGYAEYGGRYAHVAERFIQRGYRVAAPDHIGHGESGGERALLRDFEHVVDDLSALASILEVNSPGRPTIMMGHSMGGLLTARFAQRYGTRLAGVAFLGAVLGDWKWAREVLSHEELPHVDSDPFGMSRDEDVCRAYQSDPLVYHGKYQRPLLVAEVACLDRFNDEIAQITLPVGFFHGTDDPFVPYADSLAAVERMPASRRVIKLYRGAKHELVNETNRDEVITDLLDFADSLIPGEK
jgi:alpha-beta hydrolase superfamily lysophospholipase